MSQKQTINFIPWLQETIQANIQEEITKMIQNITFEKILEAKDNDCDYNNHFTLDTHHMHHHISQIFTKTSEKTIYSMLNETYNNFTTFQLDPDSSIIKHINPSTYTPLNRDIIEISQIKDNIHNLKNFKKKIIAFDLETDGTSIHSAKILQIALVSPVINKNPLLYKTNILSTYLKPSEKYLINTSSKSHEINKITQEQIQNAPSFKDIHKKVLDLITDSIIVGYNINQFDLPILKREFKELGIHNLPYAFSIDLAQAFWKNTSLNFTNALHTYHIPIPRQKLHDATTDANFCIHLLSKMIQKGKIPDTERCLDYFIHSSDNNGRRPENKIVIEQSKSFEEIPYPTPPSPLSHNNKKRKLI